MSPATTQRSRSGGFTLIEILLATAVAAILLLAIHSVFFGALRLRNTTTERLENARTLERSLDIVRADLNGIMLPGGVLSGELQSVPTSMLTQESTTGDRVSPDFYTSSGKIDGWTPFSELQMVSYYLANPTENQGSSGKNLVRVVTRNLLPVQTATTEEQILLSDVSAVSFSFFDGSTWTDTWDSSSTATLPTAIKLSLVLARPGEPANAANPNTAPIELLVPVTVTTSTSQSNSLTGGAP